VLTAASCINAGTKIDKGIDNLNIMSMYIHLGWGACVVIKNLYFGF